MTQNAIFLDCSSKVPTIKVPPLATSGAKKSLRSKKNGDAFGDEKLIFKFMWPYAI